MAYYVVFTVYLVLNVTEHDALPAYSGIMVAFVLPLTAVTITLLTAREIRARRGNGTTTMKELTNDIY